jgi:hypothetical protein
MDTLTKIEVCRADGHPLRAHATLAHVLNYLRRLGVTLSYDELQEHLDTDQLIDGTFLIRTSEKPRERPARRKKAKPVAVAENLPPVATTRRKPSGGVKARRFELTADGDVKILCRSVVELNLFLGRNARTSPRTLPIDTGVAFKGWLIQELLTTPAATV